MRLAGSPPLLDLRLDEAQLVDLVARVEPLAAARALGTIRP